MSTNESEQPSYDSAAPIVIPSLRTRTAKDWFEFAFENLVYSKAGVRESSGTCRFCTGTKKVLIKQRNGYSNFLTHMEKHRKLQVQLPN